MVLECVEFAGGGVTPMHLGERGSRAASMIEEGIVEIEQHRPRHYIPESAIGGRRLDCARIGLFVPALRGPSPPLDPGPPVGPPREGPPPDAAGRTRRP